MNGTPMVASHGSCRKVSVIFIGTGTIGLPVQNAYLFIDWNIKHLVYGCLPLVSYLCFFRVAKQHVYTKTWILSYLAFNY